MEKLKFFADVRNSNVDKTISEDEESVWLCNYTDVYYNDRISPELSFMEGSATKAETRALPAKTWSGHHHKGQRTVGRYRHPCLGHGGHAGGSVRLPPFGVRARP